MSLSSSTARALLTAFPLAAALALAGCSASADDDPVAAAQAARWSIIGGDDDPNDPAVVLILSTSSEGSFICTGEIISPHVVLTAAHCVAPSEVGAGARFRVFLGWNLDDRAQTGDKANWVEGSDSDYDKRFRVGTLNSGHDVGVVITQTAMTRKPLAIMRWPLTPNLRFQPTRLIGYGISDPLTRSGDGKKRMIETFLANYDGDFVYFNEATRGTCQGDSGGPALMKFSGTEVIVGITSFGPSGCQNGGVGTQVDKYTAWIDEHIQKYDPGFTITDAGMPPPPDMTLVPQPDLLGTTPDPPMMAEGCAVGGALQRGDARRGGVGGIEWALGLLLGLAGGRAARGRGRRRR